MKSLRRFLLCLLALQVSIAANALNFEVDGIKYMTISNDNGGMVTGYNNNATNLVLNGTVTYNGTTYDVVYINGNAFSGCTSLTKVGDLPACTCIDLKTFYNCRNLTSVGDLPACTSIGYQAFYNCINLTSLDDLPACTSIGQQAFSGCTSLMSVGDLPACTSIGQQAFSGCTSIAKVNLTNANVTSLGKDAFSQNTIIFVPTSLLETYKVANNWKDIVNQIFPIGIKTDYDITVDAKENTSAIHSKIGELHLDEVISLKITGTINSYDIMVLRNKMHNLHHLDLSDVRIIANDYEYITGYHTKDDVLGTKSFHDLKKLISVKLPTCITCIENDAFSDCSALNSVVMPEHMTSIGGAAFSGCSALKSIVISEGVTRIEKNTFSDCVILSSIIFPTSLTYIGEGAFSGCHCLRTITLPENLTYIDGGAFANCYELTSVTLPENLEIIGSGAFSGGESLAEVRIPSMVKAIGESAFANPALKDVWTYTLVPQNIGQNTFSTYSSATLHIQKTSHDAYYWNTQWSQFSQIEEFEGTYKQWLINNETDYVIDDNTGVIDTDEDATGEIEPGSGLISENEDDEQEMGTIIIEDDGSLVGSLIGHGHISSKWLKFHIKVQKAKWYFLSFPYRVPLSDIECEGS